MNRLLRKRFLKMYKKCLVKEKSQADLKKNTRRSERKYSAEIAAAHSGERYKKTLQAGFAESMMNLPINAK